MAVVRKNWSSTIDGSKTDVTTCIPADRYRNGNIEGQSALSDFSQFSQFSIQFLAQVDLTGDDPHALETGQF